MILRKYFELILLILWGFYLRSVDGKLLRESDCSALALPPRRGMFVRVDDHSYRCLPNSIRVHGCAAGHRIPHWYRAGHEDPCICNSFLTRGLRIRWLCPPRPLDRPPPQAPSIPVNIRPPPEGRIGDSGCPSPMMRFSSVRRTNTATSFILTLGGTFGFHLQEEECKMLCLMVGVCQSVQYTFLTRTVGLCRGFTDRGYLTDVELRRDTNMYWKMNCENGGARRSDFQNAMLTTPTPLVNGVRGPVFPNYYQPNGIPLDHFRVYSEGDCFSYCKRNSTCMATDYNKYTNECWMHKYSSCSLHRRAQDSCCSHFKKMLC